MGSKHAGIYLAGPPTRELELVRAWAGRHCRAVVWLSQESAVELEVPAEAALVVIDAHTEPFDAVVQVARIRAAHANVPIMLFGAGSGERDSFLRAALRSGANAVLERPFDELGLCAALQRLAGSRSRHRPGGVVALSPSCRLDLEGRCLRVGRVAHPLTRAKFDLLAYLVQHAGRAVSAEELVRAGIFVPSQRARYRAIMLELRDKLGEARSVIRTVPGYGYRFEPPASKESESRGQLSD